MRNFVFGVEDSLVSTVGLLSGVAVANVPKEIILLSGAVLISVEALSMGAGSFLSEVSVEKYLTKNEGVNKTSFIAGVVMFFSYLLAGFIPLGPYILLPITSAFWVSIAISSGALFVLGIVGAKISQTSLIKGGVRMLLVGGTTLGIGVVVGRLFSGF